MVILGPPAPLTGVGPCEPGLAGWQVSPWRGQGQACDKGGLGVEPWEIQADSRGSSRPRRPSLRRGVKPPTEEESGPGGHSSPATGLPVSPCVPQVPVDGGGPGAPCLLLQEPLLSCVPHCYAQEVSRLCHLSAGTYRIVPSTYLPDTEGAFTVTIATRIDRRSIHSRERLGQLLQEVSAGLSRGGPSAPPGLPPPLLPGPRLPQAGPCPGTQAP